MDVIGVDVGWVQGQLRPFIAETRAVNQSSSSSGATFITARTAPACVRDKALAMSDVVRPILDRLYPEWRSENTGTKNDESLGERDAAKRLLARLDKHAEVAEKLGGADTSPRLAAGALHPLIWSAAEAQ